MDDNQADCGDRGQHCGNTCESGQDHPQRTEDLNGPHTFDGRIGMVFHPVESASCDKLFSGANDLEPTGDDIDER
ncbi:hypothetical protein A5746_10805 [Mycolicibacterium conceptionense]|nr:hypothetical protein A5746_10805 [Mycolicibacterium conceptionense]